MVNATKYLKEELTPFFLSLFQKYNREHFLTCSARAVLP